jgi:hypothetical protein
MNDKQIHERAIHKAESQISFIQLEMSALERETPYMSYTQDMIDGQQAFKIKELDTWRMIIKALKWHKKTRYTTPNFETKFGKTTKYK